MDFFRSMSDKESNGLGRRTLCILIGTAFLNTVGFETLGLIFPYLYGLFEGIKDIISGLIISYMVIIVGRDILRTLRVLQINTLSQQSPVDSAEHLRLQRTSRSLTIKLVIFIVVVTIMSFALFGYAILSLSAPNFQWTCTINDAQDPAQIALKAGFICICSYYCLLFPTPSLPDANHNNPDASMFETAIDDGVLFQIHEGDAEFALTRAHKNLMTKLLQGELMVSGNSRNVSVLIKEEIAVNDSDVFFTPWLGPERVHKLSRSILWILGKNHKGRYILFWTGVTLGGSALAGVVLSAVVSNYLAIICPWLPLFILVVFGTFVSRTLFLQEVKKFWLAWRLFSTTLSTLAFGVALGDIRILVLPGLWLSFNLLWVSDGFIEIVQSYRLPLAISIFFVHAMIIALLLTNQIPSSNRTLVLSSTFDYSALQLVRDMYIAQSLLLLFEIDTLVRNAHKRRLLHLGRPVSTHIQTFANDPGADMSELTIAQKKPLGLQSGFIVQGISRLVSQQSQSDFSENVSRFPKKVQVFVNKIEIRQVDSFAVAMLGYNRGRSWVEWLQQGHHNAVVEFFSFSFAFACLLSFPLIRGDIVPVWIPALSIISGISLAWLRGSVLSIALAKILVQRRQFAIQTVFMMILIALLCVTLRDWRITIAVYIVELALFDYLADARVTIPGRSGPCSRIGDKVMLSMMLLILVCFMIWDVVESRLVYVVFRPDLEANGTSINPDASYVVDVFQSTVDLMVSLLLERGVAIFLFIWRSRPQEMLVVQAPIRPRFGASVESNNLQASSLVSPEVTQA